MPEKEYHCKKCYEHHHKEKHPGEHHKCNECQEKHRKECHPHHLKLPLWYPVTVIFYAVYSLFIFFAADFLPIPFHYFDLALSLVWLVFNIFLLIYFVTKKYQMISIVLPIYFIISFAFWLYLIYLISIGSVMLTDQRAIQLMIISKAFEVFIASSIIVRK